MRRSIAAAIAVLACGLGVTPAWAQTGKPAQTTARPAPRGPRGYEFTVAGAWVGPTSFGTSSADLLTPAGSTLTLFSTTNDLRPGYGLEMHLSKRVTPRFALEGSGTVTRATLRSKISLDFEDAADVEVTESLTRFTVTGAALWTLATRGQASYFIRGGAGWLRELVGDGALIEDGIVGDAGAGFKYMKSGTGRRRVGFRVEGRLEMRHSGVTLGEDKLRMSPVIAGGLIIGF
ncbi:MAG TPA: hypothetical protein VFV98_07580 [Vicinamibacterales bacterium]|nr:hypothetical protein [Vicinamibacterales bacterium]